MTIQSLAEYAAAHPTEQPPELNTGRNEYADHIARSERAQTGRATVLKQLQQGAAPGIVLLTAVDIIDALAPAPGWAQQCREYIAESYTELQQQSFLIDTATEAEQRLDATRREYHKKTAAKLRTMRNACSKLMKEIDETQRALDAIAPDQSGETTQ